jgi:two-component system chemotaxis response regulator CheY
MTSVPPIPTAAPAARVLVVDDAATVRLFHRKVLGDAGYTVHEAANGLEALEKALSAAAAATPFDLLVVDVNMPRMDGYRFVRELRRHAELPPAPVLMVSTEAQVRDATAGREAGANAYLVKPARPHDLLLTAALLLGDAPRALAAAKITADRARAGAAA